MTTASPLLPQPQATRDRGWWRALPVLLALVLVARQLAGKWPPNAIWGIRHDDFWAFSGGHVRRGLLGEILYQGAGMFGGGVVAAAAFAFLVVYGVAAWRIASLLDLRNNWRWFWPLAASAVYLNYTVDREVLLLLPLFIVPSWGGATLLRRSVFLASILVMGFVHEFALLLFGPILAVLLVWEQSSAGRWLLRVGLVLMAVEMAMLVGLKSTPTAVLETMFWPAYGIEGLERSNLYAFATMSLGKVLALHGRMVKTPSGLWDLALQCSLMTLLLCWFRESKPFCLAVVLWMLPASVLSIDYGRYAYLTFFAFVLAWYQLGPGQSWRALPRGRGGPVLVAALVLVAVPNSFFAGSEPARVSIKRELDLVLRVQAALLRSNIGP